MGSRNLLRKAEPPSARTGPPEFSLPARRAKRVEPGCLEWQRIGLPSSRAAKLTRCRSGNFPCAFVTVKRVDLAKHQPAKHQQCLHQKFPVRSP